MPTALLNDEQVRPSEYRKWKHAHQQFARGKDRATVDAYKAAISANGGRLTTPIRLSVDDRTHEVAIADGHHRAIAVIELGLTEFHFTWGWRRAWTVTHERAPFPDGILT
jgi:hypothetical protein